MLPAKLQEKLERFKAQSEILGRVSMSKDETIITISLLSAALLVIATFNSELLPVSNTIRTLLTALLILIPISVFLHLINMDRVGNKAIKRINDIIGDRKITKREDKFNKMMSFYPYIAASVVSIVILVLIFLIWNNPSEPVSSSTDEPTIEVLEGNIGELRLQIKQMQAQTNQAQADLKQLYCDLNSSITAERKYTYPILRSLGYNPDDYGKGVDNPITTQAKYKLHCN